MAAMTAKKRADVDPLAEAKAALRARKLRHDEDVQRGEDEMTDLVAALIALGGTWVDVGEGVGMTRGNAQRKYGALLVIEKTVSVRSTNRRS